MRSHCWDMFGLPLPTLCNACLTTCCILEWQQMLHFNLPSCLPASPTFDWQATDLFLRAML